MSGCPFSGASTGPNPHLKSISDSDIDYEVVEEAYAMPLQSPYDSLVKLYIRSQVASKNAPGQSRFRFENLPLYLQNTLFHPKHIKKFRHREVMEKFLIFADMKSAGNIEYRKADYRKALSIHEQVLGLFTYLDLLRETPDSEDTNVIDSDYELRSTAAKDLQEDKMLRDMVGTCYLNMAACALRLNAFGYVIALASEAVRMLPDCALAYARRSQAKICDLESSISALESGVEDAEHAYRIDPRKEYRELASKGKERISTEQLKERTFFSNFFASVKKFGWIEVGFSPEDFELEHVLIQKMVEKYREMVVFYEETEKREKLVAVRQEMQVVLGVCMKMNWIRRISPTAPSAIMLEEAVKAGVDLTDTKTQDIIECVKRMEISSSFSGPKYNDQLVKYCIDLITQETRRQKAVSNAKNSNKGWGWWVWAGVVLGVSWVSYALLVK